MKFPGKNATIAPLLNVTLCLELVELIVSRPDHLPGLGVFQGPSGYGKTFSATYARNEHDAVYLEVGESWTKGTFLKKLATQVGGETKGTISDIMDEILKALVMGTRPIFIDEADVVVDRGYIETVREIHDKTGTPILLIGEEKLGQKLSRFERVHNRVMKWEYAQPSDVNDVAALLRVYYGDEVTIDQALLEKIVNASGGRTRRVCSNLDQVINFARHEGLTSVSVKDWGTRDLFTGLVPTRQFEGGM